MSINSVTISGNLTRDPELRDAGGAKVLRFSVAVNDRRRNRDTGEWEDHPNFIDCAIFGKRAEGLARVLHKGNKISVQGSLRYNSWRGKDGQRRSSVSVLADELELMGGHGQQPAQQDVYDGDMPF